MNVAGFALIVAAVSMTNLGLEAARFVIGAPRTTSAQMVSDRCFRAGADHGGCQYTYEVQK